MYPVKGTPKDHQLRALQEADFRPGHAFWMDPGAGKTFTCIAEAGLLYQRGDIDGMIIVAPMGPHAQWIEEQFPLWADFPYSAAHNKMSDGKIAKFLERRQQGMGVFAINYDSLRTPGGEAMVAKFMEHYPRVYLVVDESQKIKDGGALRTKATLMLSLRAAYRRLLSGTPILKGLEDLWSQYEAVQPGLAWQYEPIRLGPNGRIVSTGYFGYRNHYCKMAPVPGRPHAKRIVGYKNEEELRERVRPYSTRILAEEFMKGEVPDFIPIPTPMTSAQKVQYKLMRDHLIALIDRGEVTAQNALVQMGKLHQIACGFLIDEEKETHSLGDNKVSAAMDLIEGFDEPVIIWAPFIYLQEMMVAALEEEGYGSRIYSRHDIEAWKRDDSGILVGNQTSGLGVGMNLQHAAANIYLTNSFSSEARWQSIKRTDRIGQTRQVRIWDFITPDTVEEKVMQALADKQDISRRNIDQLREML